MEGALDQYVVQGLGNNITFLRDVYRNPRYCYFFLYYLLIFYSRVCILLLLLLLCVMLLTYLATTATIH